ncbi:hypothetical protein [Nocardia macrotermitis]|uniref:Uncharacterized protein n=1 Tax=Nocardia macrotermitis TaxID=2585198 RepID=A0A7K0CZQ6_9NOCA|nr:hypothetical protein [Nocardia macrotermitis]MQY18963.1 hypothetical protein [Nocardia macrotermitis]
MATPPPDPSTTTAEAITAIRTLVQAQNLRQAKYQLRQLEKGIDDQTWLIITEIAHTLRFKTHDAALGKLRNLWYRNETHRALIEACVPKKDEGQHIRQPAREPRPTPDEIRPHAGTVTEAYEDNLGKSEREDPGTERKELIVDRRDYDLDAVDRGHIGLCVSCRLERYAIDRYTGQIQSGHGDDGLCSECRSLGRPGVPELPLEHTYRDSIEARMTFLAESFNTHGRALFRQEWDYASHKARPIIEAWVKSHTTPEPPPKQLLIDTKSLNGECAKCNEWRQLRDQLCVDCHPGLGGETATPAGSITPDHPKQGDGGSGKPALNDSGESGIRPADDNRGIGAERAATGQGGLPPSRASAIGPEVTGGDDHRRISEAGKATKRLVRAARRRPSGQQPQRPTRLR